MSDENTTIDSAITGRAVYNVVVEDGKTAIVDAVTGAVVYVINGEIGAGVKSMTTEEREAITPDAGALIYDSDQDVLYLGDGVTPGGNALGGTGGGDYIAGRWTDIVNGATISEKMYEDIETVDISGAFPSVTMKPGHAYSINATTKEVVLNTDVFPESKFGKEGHLQIFVAGTGHVRTGENVVLKEPLEPDSINNCTVRFHGGSATISVEDNIGGYIVTEALGTTVGTLPYALASAGSSYIAFDASLNGTVIPLAGAVANGEKHVVGNGYADTLLTGAVDCGTSKFTVANLELQNVVVNGGTLTLGDAFIPSGSTVAADGGGLAVERCENNGVIQNVGNRLIPMRNGAHFYGNGVVELELGHLVVSGTTAHISGLVFSGGSTGNFGAQLAVNDYSTSHGVAYVSGCTFTGATFYNRSGVATVYAGGDGHFSNCVFENNKTTADSPVTGCAAFGMPSAGADATAELVSCTIRGNTGYTKVYLGRGGQSLTISDSVIDEGQDINNYGAITLSGSNTIKAKLHTVDASSASVAGSGTVTITSGAIVDLTGNANATPIAPGGGIIVADGDMTASCTIINSAGSAVPLMGGTYSEIFNTGGAD